MDCLLSTRFPHVCKFCNIYTLHPTQLQLHIPRAVRLNLTVPFTFWEGAKSLSVIRYDYVTKFP